MQKWATTEPKCYTFKAGQLAQLAQLAEGSAKRRERERGRKQCFDNFNAAIANKFDGPFNDPRCERNLYLLDGQEYTDKEQYEIAKISKQEKEALAKYKSWLSGPPPGDGKYSDASVGKWGAFEGTEVKDEAQYLAKQREKQKNEFGANVQIAKANNFDGLVKLHGIRMYTWNGRGFETQSDWQKARTPAEAPKAPDAFGNPLVETAQKETCAPVAMQWVAH